MNEYFWEGYEARGRGDYLNPYDQDFLIEDEEQLYRYNSWNEGFAEADVILAEAGVDFL